MPTPSAYNDIVKPNNPFGTFGAVQAYASAHEPKKAALNVFGSFGATALAARAQSSEASRGARIVAAIGREMDTIGTAPVFEERQYGQFEPAVYASRGASSQPVAAVNSQAAGMQIAPMPVADFSFDEPEVESPTYH